MYANQHKCNERVTPYHVKLHKTSMSTITIIKCAPIKGMNMDQGINQGQLELTSLSIIQQPRNRDHTT